MPASPQLLDLLLSLPVMDTTRARTELDWQPRHASTEVIAAFLEGLRTGAGRSTPPLLRDAGGRGRWREVASGVGSRDGASPVGGTRTG